MPSRAAQRPILDWYDSSSRDLPWRRPEVGPWAVLVSEVMLQQTPVARVLPVYGAWMRRWPAPAALAAESPGQAIRGWGRLGYPRRALRLHEAAAAIGQRHDGRVPSSVDDLRRLPGVGEYTAAAVAAFAFGQRTVVLDTNVRRVLSRLLVGVEHPPARLSRAERLLAGSVLPESPSISARWNVAVMELGAVICTASAPRCDRCPVSSLCAWRLAGYPAANEERRHSQTYAGTDRECRGRILSALRESDLPVPIAVIDATWDDAVQLERALASLVSDGLVVRASCGTFALP